MKGSSEITHLDTVKLFRFVRFSLELLLANYSVVEDDRLIYCYSMGSVAKLGQVNFVLKN